MTAYNQGKDDFKKGIDFWQNPHCYEWSSRNETAAWFAGWCYQKQQGLKLTEGEK